MKQLFPVLHAIGFVSSLLLSLIALVVIKFHLSFGVGMTILAITMLAVIPFMPVGENENKLVLLMDVGYALFVGLVTILGTSFTRIFG